MSSISKNPFASLNEDDDEPPTTAPAGAAAGAAAPVRTTAGPAKKDHATKDDSKSKAAAGIVPKEGKPARRENDRRDASGRGTRPEKKGGNGKGNWGKEDELAPLTPKKEVSEAEQAELDAAAEKADEERKKEAAQKTIGEYRKQQEVERLAFAPQEGRKAEEMDMKGLKVKEEVNVENDLMDLAGTKTAKGKKGSSGRKGQAVTDVGFTAPAPAPSASYDDRGAAGGRGGGRGGARGGGLGRGGGGGRGGGARGERSGPAPNLADESAFPAF
jgi:hypothetical protein